MFAIGFLCMFTLSFFEGNNMKKIAKDDSIKNIMMTSLVLIGFCSALIAYLITTYSQGITSLKYDKEILTDYRFYVALLSEMVGFYVTRKNYSDNGDNIAVINFTLFLSLVLVPLYAYFLTDLLGFKDTIKINYENGFEFFLFISFMLLLSFLFFFDKIKTNKIKNIKILIILPLILSNSMFMTGKLMQEYNAFYTYAMISLFLSFFFLFFAIKGKEYKNFKKAKHQRDLMIIVTTWSIAIPLNAIAIKFLAIELVTLLKRVSQVIAGVILDKIYKNKNILKKKDYIIIILIFTIGIIMQKQ